MLLPYSEYSEELLKRPFESDESVTEAVMGIIDEVRKGGDEALRSLSERFDGCRPDSLFATAEEIAEAEASIPQDTLIGSGPDISLFPFRQQYLSLLPNFSGYNGREEVLVPKLLLRLGKAEGLIDLVALTFVANQRTDVTLILQNSAHHPPVPEVLF